MAYVKGDILELESGLICTVVQAQERCYVCLEGVYPPEGKPAEEWPFRNVRESAVANKLGNLNDKDSVQVALAKLKGGSK